MALTSCQGQPVRAARCACSGNGSVAGAAVVKIMVREGVMGGVMVGVMGGVMGRIIAILNPGPKPRDGRPFRLIVAFVTYAPQFAQLQRRRAEGADPHAPAGCRHRSQPGAAANVWLCPPSRIY